MEIKVGIQRMNREVVVETSEKAEAVEKALNEALKDGGLFTLTDERGRKVMIPGSSIGYVEFGEEHARRVGFGAV